MHLDGRLSGFSRFLHQIQALSRSLGDHYWFSAEFLERLYAQLSFHAH